MTQKYVYGCVTAKRGGQNSQPLSKQKPDKNNY